MRGSARLQFKDPEEWVDLSVGDQLLIPAHRRHRLVRTDPHPGTLWLALYWHCELHSSCLAAESRGVERLTSQ